VRPFYCSQYVCIYHLLLGAPSQNAIATLAKQPLSSRTYRCNVANLYYFLSYAQSALRSKWQLLQPIDPIAIVTRFLLAEKNSVPRQDFEPLAG